MTTLQPGTNQRPLPLASVFRLGVGALSVGMSAIRGSPVTAAPTTATELASSVSGPGGLGDRVLQSGRECHLMLLECHSAFLILSFVLPRVQAPIVALPLP